MQVVNNKRGKKCARNCLPLRNCGQQEGIHHEICEGCHICGQTRSTLQKNTSWISFAQSSVTWKESWQSKGGMLPGSAKACPPSRIRSGTVVNEMSFLAAPVRGYETQHSKLMWGAAWSFQPAALQSPVPIRPVEKGATIDACKLEQRPVPPILLRIPMDTKKGNNMTNMIQYDLTFAYAPTMNNHEPPKPWKIIN